MGVFMESLMKAVLATLTAEVRGESEHECAFGVWRYAIPPGGGPGWQMHREADEFFYVLRGKFDFQLGARAVPAAPGSLVFIRRGAVHSFTNVGAELDILIGGVMPAGFEKYLAAWDDAD